MIMFKFFKEFLPATSKLHTRQIKTKQFLTFSNHMNVTCFKQLHEPSIDVIQITCYISHWFQVNSADIGTVRRILTHRQELECILWRSGVKQLLPKQFSQFSQKCCWQLDKNFSCMHLMSISYFCIEQCRHQAYQGNASQCSMVNSGQTGFWQKYKSCHNTGQYEYSTIY